MTYQQIISTPCAAMSGLTYEAFFKLLNASYREFIMMEAQQKDENNMTYYEDRSKKMVDLERHIHTLEKHAHYKRYYMGSSKQIAA